MHFKENTDKHLMVLNASAGSGKTYTLVKEFIKLLIDDSVQKKHFSQIIAMTFTNMASLEMKTRILAALDELSNPEYASAKGIELAEVIGNEIGVSVEEVHAKSQTILKNLLHSYEDFSVMTIDKFNLRLIRSFSRDLDLPSDFDVVLNENQLIEQVVDLLMSGMGTEEEKEFTNAAINYAKSNLDEEEAWDFRRSLISFGSTFSKEKDQVYLGKLLDSDFSFQTLQETKSEIQRIDEEFKSLTNELFRIHLAHESMSSSYPNGSHTLQAIISLNETSGFIEKRTHAKTISACLAETPKGKFFPEELKQSFLKIHDFQTKVSSEYAVYKLFIKNFHNMYLLKFMAVAIEKMKQEEKVIRISEFNKLISDLVRQENAPFIYERLGTRYQHFLLDEFQDTSHLQWLNLVPLVEESLSNGRSNLIVGDPKQSIYRFKNGVAEQFVKLPGIYNPEKDPEIQRQSEFFEKLGFKIDLNDNWRSGRSIVEFNNAIFSLLKNDLPEFSKDFYNSIHQNPKSKNYGFVSVQSKNAKEKEEFENRDQEVLDTIERCLSQGYFPNDICILTETNKEANRWALNLKRKNYKVVSAESLLVDNDQRVNVTISFLKRRLKPAKRSEMKRFAELYYRSEFNNNFEKFRSFIKKEEKEGKTCTYFDNNNFIISHFGSLDRFFYKYENIYDLIQQFYTLMGWTELKNPYLHHLADFAYEYEQINGPDLSGFLDLYEEKRGKLAIETPASSDAIVVMTIHKSKGLEFPIVLLPDCNFEVKIKTSNKFLLEANGKILHTTLSGSNSIEEIKELHKEETEHILTDKMNLLYVGFTRPKDRLYIFNYWKDNFGSLLHKAIQVLSENTSEEMIHYTSGQEEYITREQKSSSNFFIPKSVSDHLWFPDIALSEKKKEDELQRISEEQRFGSQFHLLMAELDVKTSVIEKTDQLISEGKIESVFRDRMIDQLENVMKSPEFLSLFENAQDILNEQVILLDHKETKRPDKIILKSTETIVLDYKTGIPKNSHHKQMQEYVSLLQEMNYPNVRGYLYYTLTNELVLMN